MKRNREDTIESFDRWFTQLNHFPWVSAKLRKEISRFENMKTYDNCYPQFNLSNFKMGLHQKFPTILQGAETYYDFYYKRCDELIKKFPDRVRQVDSYQILNDSKTEI